MLFLKAFCLVSQVRVGEGGPGDRGCGGRGGERRNHQQGPFSSRCPPLTSLAPLTECVLQIGTYQTAVCSKAHNKPFYVVAESFKFVRLYPLNQQDVPDKFKVRCYWTRLHQTAPPAHISPVHLCVCSVQSRHAEDGAEPVGGASRDRLHASVPHHPPLHRPRSPHPVGRQRRAHQALFITAPKC